MPIEPTPIDPVPTPVPSQDDPTNFPARGDAMMEWFPDGIDQLNDLAADTYDNAVEVFNAATEIAAAALVAADAAGFVAVSTSTLTVSAGTKTIHFNAPKPNLAVATYQVGIVLASDNSIKMIGNIAGSPAPDPDDITVTVVSSGVSGSGSYSGPWLIVAGAFLGTGATAAEILAAVTDAAAVSPKGLKDALAPYALTDAATVTPSGLNGLDFTWTIGGNRTLGAMTNTYPGARGKIKITQDGTGSRILAVSSVYKRAGGLAVLSTTAGAIDYFEYEVDTVDGSGTATRVIYGLLKAPS